MSCLELGRYALSVGAFALLVTGCSRSSVPDAGPGGAMSSMMRQATSGALLYVVAIGGSVYVISYPQGSLVNTITNVDGPQGACSDKNGNVFITAFWTENVLEYAHGGTKPVASLGDYGYYPLGCAVDPTTGNLAVANQQSMNGGGGNVAIYANAKGKPTFYNTYNSAWCAYDPNGNLFVVSTGGSLSELRAGSQSFISISLPVSGQGIQWDGQYLAIVNPASKVVYRIAISGSAGTLKQTVKFSGLIRSLGYDFALDGNTIIMPFAMTQNRFSKIGLWKYPRGGKVGRTIHPAGTNDYYSPALSL
jgi:DNA-binding beta-propeller fold protein YncE